MLDGFDELSFSGDSECFPPDFGSITFYSDLISSTKSSITDSFTLSSIIDSYAIDLEILE